MDSPLITVLTPSYNRAHTLPRLAESLARQDGASFEWLVADDGSTDGTEPLVRDIAASARFPVAYAKGENGGKHRALNRAMPLARGAWTFIVDSDDALPEGSLERITRIVREVEADASIGGIMGHRGDIAGGRIGPPFPPGIDALSATDITFRAGIRGDKSEVYRTEMLRRFPFPEIEGERFVNECVVWYRIARAGYKLRLVDEVVYLCEYQADGLSAKSLRLRLENPRGTLLYYGEELELGYPARALFREAANYCRFALGVHGISGALGDIGSLGPRARRLAAAALPLGAAAALLDSMKRGGRR